MFLLRYVGGAGLGKKPCAACLGGTLSFGTFREKRKKTLTRNGDHSIKTKDLYLVEINRVLGACVECIITHAFWVVLVVLLRGQVLTLDGWGVLCA